MQNIQNAILNYAHSNKYFSALLKISTALAVIYPIYSLLVHITALSVIWKYVGLISAVLYIAYYVGTILSFAANKLIPLDIAYGCLTLNYIFNLRYGITLNRLVYIVFYALIVSVCIIATKKGSQWNRFKEKTFSKVAQYAEAADNAISNEQVKNTICPNCGAKLDKKMKFCNNCGTQINQ